MKFAIVYLICLCAGMGLIRCIAKDVPYVPTRPEKPEEPCLDTLGPYPDCPPKSPNRRD